MIKTVDFSDIAIEESTIDKLIKNQDDNNVYAGYYTELAALAKIDNDYDKANYYEKKARGIRFCNKHMTFDHFEKLGAKGYKRTYHCRDRFCPICAKKLADNRAYQFKKHLDAAAEQYNLYHFTFTMTNCRGLVAPWKISDKQQNMLCLKDNVKLMSKCFQKVIRYLSGNAKIRGIDFSQYGYAGAIRSLEITYYIDQTYHPHYHVILAMKKGLELPGENYNDYSWDYIKKEYLPFTDFEILIQKIWYLVLNGKKITKEAIDGIKQGYSCRIRLLGKDDYHQTFKYTIKPDDETKMTFEIFRDLQEALYGMRSIQGYGCFHNLKIAEDIREEVDPIVDEFMNKLCEIEKPVECYESPHDVKDNIRQRKCFYFSPASIRAWGRKQGISDEEFALITASPERVRQFVQLMMQLPEPDKLQNFDYLDGGRSIKPKLNTAEVITKPILSYSYSDDDDIGL